MSKEIDKRIVEMDFDNKEFEKNVKQSMSTIERLKAALNFDSVKTTQSIANATKNVKFTGLENSMNQASIKIEGFSTGAVAKFTVMQRGIQAVMDKVGSIIKTNPITQGLNQIVEGGKRRSQNIEQAKFQLEGLGIAWKNVADDINYAVDGTAYGLDVAAKAAAQLSASNVQLGDDMKAALRGISGVAAMTNTEYEEISRIFTAVAGSGRVFASEMNRISDRGLNAWAALSKYMGVTEAEVHDMVSKGVVDFQTFANAMDSAFGEHAKDANKTFSGAMSNVRAALSRIGQQFADPVFANMIDILNSLRGVINSLNKSLTPFYQTFSKIMKGIRDYVVGILDNPWLQVVNDNIVTTFWNIGRLIVEALAPIGRAWKAVFPKANIEAIAELTLKIRNFFATLKMNETVAKAMELIFRGLFTTIKLAVTGIGNLVKGIGYLLTPLKNVRAAANDLTGGIGHLSDKFKTFWEQNQIGYKIFTGIFTVFGSVVAVIGTAITGIINLVKKIKDLVIQSGVLEKALQGLYIVGLGLKTVFGYVATAILGTIGAVGALIYKLASFIASCKGLEVISSGVTTIKDKFAELRAMKFNSISDILSAIINGIKRGIAYLGQIQPIKGLLTAIQKLLTKIKTTFPGLTNALKKIGDSFKKVFGGIHKNLTNGSGSSNKTLIQVLLEGIMDTYKNLLTTVKAGNPDITWVDRMKAGFQTLWEYMKKFVSQVTPSKILIFGLTLMMINFVGSVKKLAYTLTGTVSAVKGFFTGINGVLNQIKANLAKKGNTLHEMVNLVIAISASIAVLSMIPRDKLENAVAAMTTVIVAIGIIKIVLSLIGKMKSKQEGVSEFKASIEFSMLQIAGAILAIAAAAKIIDGLDPNRLMTTMLATTGVIGLCAILMAAMSKLQSDKKLAISALSIVALGIAIRQMAKAFVTIDALELNDIGKKLAAFSVMIAGMALLLKTVGKVNVGGVITLIALIVALGKLPPIIDRITAMGWGDLLTKVKDTFAKIGEILLSIIAFVPTLSNQILLISQKLGETGRAVVGFVAVVGTLIAVRKLVSRVSSRITLLSKDFMEFGAGLLLIVIALKVLQGIGLKLETAIAGIGLVIGFFSALTIMFAILGRFDYSDANKLAKSFVGLAASLAIIMGAIGVMTLFMRNADQNTWATFGKLTAMLAGLMVVFGVMARLSRYSNLKLGGLIGVMLNLMLLMTYVALLTTLTSEIGLEPVLAAGSIIGGIMIALASLMRSISGNKIDAKGVLSLLVVSGTLVGLGAMLTQLAKCDWYNIAAATASMYISIMMYAKLLRSINRMTANLDFNKMAMIAGSVAIMAVIAVGLIGLAQQPWDSVLASGAAMSGAIIAYAFMLAALSRTQVNDPVSLMVNMLGGIGALVSIGIALSQLAKYPWQSILGASAAMSLSMIALGGVLTIMSNFGSKGGMIAGAAAMVLASTSLIIVANALAQVAQIDWDNISSKFFIFVGVMAAVVTVMGLIGAIPAIGQMFSIALLAVGASLIMASTSMLIAANAIKVGVEAINLLGPALTSAGVGLEAAMIAIASGLTALQPALESIQNINLLGIAGGLAAIGAALAIFVIPALGMMVMAGALVLAAQGLNAMVPSVLALSQIDLQNVGLGLKELAIGGAEFALAGLAMIPAAIGVQAMAVVLPVLAAGIAIASTAMENGAIRIKNAVATIKQALEIDLVSAASNAVSGFVNGISNGISSVITVAKSMAEKFLGTFNAVLGIHSPSLEFLKSGLNAVAGLVNGFKSGYSEARASGQGLAQSALAGLSGIVSGAKNLATQAVSAFTSTFSGGITSYLNGVKSTINNQLGSTAALNEKFGRAADNSTMAANGFMESIDAVLNKLKGTTSTTASGDSGLIGAVEDASASMDDFATATGGSTGGSGGGGATGSLKDLTDAANDATVSMDGLSTATSSANEEVSTEKVSKWDKLAAKLEKLKAKAESANTAINSLAQSMFNWFDMTSDKAGDLQEAIDHTKELEELQKEHQENITSFEEQEASLKEKLAKYEALQARAYAGGFEDEIDDIKRQLADLDQQREDELEKYNENVEKLQPTDPQTYLDNLQSQLDIEKAWKENIEKLKASGLSDELINYLEGLGVEGYETVQTFMNMSNDQIQQANTLYQQAMDSSYSYSRELVALYDEAGVKAGDKFAKKLAKAQKKAKKAGKELGVAALEGIKLGLSDYSFATTLASNKSLKSAKNAVANIVENTGYVEEAFTRLGTTIKNTLSQVNFSTIDLTQYANSVVSTINDGLNLNPVITPTLDTSLMEYQMSRMASMYSMGSKYGASIESYNGRYSTTYARIDSSSMNELADTVVNAINNNMKDVAVTVDVTADQDGVYKLVRDMNIKETRRINYNPLSMQAT